MALPPDNNESHLDVNIPAHLRPHAGKLLAEFQVFLERQSYTPWRIAKPPGKHCTHHWLYLSLEARAPRKTQLQFGETTFKDVNPIPHLWVRGKAPYRCEGRELLSKFLDNLRLCIHEFDPEAYGADYLPLVRGSLVQMCSSPTGVAAEGWAYGTALEDKNNEPSRKKGWFPPSFVVTQ